MKDNHEVLLDMIGITENDLDLIIVWCFTTSPESKLGFDYEERGIWIYNIFLDVTGRFRLSLEGAVKQYSFASVSQFCHVVLEHVHNLCNLVREISEKEH